jgi:hypothetical protein
VTFLSFERRAKASPVCIAGVSRDPRRRCAAIKKRVARFDRPVLVQGATGVSLPFLCTSLSVVREHHHRPAPTNFVCSIVNATPVSWSTACLLSSRRCARAPPLWWCPAQCDCVRLEGRGQRLLVPRSRAGANGSCSIALV